MKGPNDVLNLFSPAKKVSIDLKNYTEPGTYTVPVSVELPDGCTLVNEVNVEITLENSSRAVKHRGKARTAVRQRQMKTIRTARANNRQKWENTL